MGSWQWAIDAWHWIGGWWTWLQGQWSWGNDLWTWVKANPSLIGIVVSLAWNLANTLLAGRQWKRNANFTEFRSLKPPIDVAVGELRSMKTKLQNQTALGGADKSYNNNIKTLNKELADAWGKAVAALEACDVSHLWPHDDLAVRFNTAWEEIVDELNAIYTQTSLPAKQKQTSSVAVKVGDLATRISREIDQCVSDKIKGRSIFRFLAFWRLFRRKR